ncbi:hypothetical protein EDB80DRAFT_673531 [Ilyonectria destructans]|nr:hypothetical protein EDB80DRAFT_673531 [Ilyonectria destructans]
MAALCVLDSLLVVAGVRLIEVVQGFLVLIILIHFILSSGLVLNGRDDTFNLDLMLFRVAADGGLGVFNITKLAAPVIQQDGIPEEDSDPAPGLQTTPLNPRAEAVAWMDLNPRSPPV